MFVQEIQQGPPREEHPQRQGDLAEQEAPWLGSQELPLLGWSCNLTYCVTSEKLLFLSEPPTSPQKEGVELVGYVRLTCDRTRFSRLPHAY